MTTIDVEQLKASIEMLKVLQSLGIGGAVGPAPQGSYRRGYNGPKRTRAEMLAAKDKSILAGFKRKGIENVVLLDRTDRTKDFNVRPYGRPAGVDEDGNPTPANGWIGQGRIVKKGETSVLGMFHVSQTEPLPATVDKKKAN